MRSASETSGDAGKATYERVAALAERMDDAGRQEFAALLSGLLVVGDYGDWRRVAVRRWLRDAGWVK